MQIMSDGRAELFSTWPICPRIPICPSIAVCPGCREGRPCPRMSQDIFRCPRTPPLLAVPAGCLKSEMRCSFKNSKSEVQCLTHEQANVFASLDHPRQASMAQSIGTGDKKTANGPLTSDHSRQASMAQASCIGDAYKRRW